MAAAFCKYCIEQKMQVEVVISGPEDIKAILRCPLCGEEK